MPRLAEAFLLTAKIKEAVCFNPDMNPEAKGASPKKD